MVGKGQIEGRSGDWEESIGMGGVQRAGSLNQSLGEEGIYTALGNWTSSGHR